MSEMGRVVTSEALAPMLMTNPVVVRRTMAGLRDAGIVRSEKGHGGGWSLARDLAAVSLGDVYDALGTPGVFGIGHRTESPGCVVEQAVNRALGKALDEAEALLVAQLRRTTLAALASEVGKLPERHGKHVAKGTKHHV
jgi:DNA-binding IscR family transcriptional regulator